MKMIDVKKDILNQFRDQIKEMHNRRNWPEEKKRQYKIEQGIFGIAHQVTVNNESFLSVFLDWTHETSLNQVDQQHVKEQAIKLINERG